MPDRKRTRREERSHSALLAELHELESWNRDRKLKKRMIPAEWHGLDRTVPCRPMTCRTTTGGPSRGGMQSSTVTAPASVSKSVSRIRVVSRYRRFTERTPGGASRQNPLSGWPSSAAKHAPESKRGMQSQSMEPERDTSAAVSPSPMSA